MIFEVLNGAEQDLLGDTLLYNDVAAVAQQLTNFSGSMAVIDHKGRAISKPFRNSDFIFMVATDSTSVVLLLKHGAVIGEANAVLTL